MKYKLIIAAAIVSAATAAGAADKKYGVGVTDTEIKLGQTSPYSGPASAYSVIAKAQAAYFKMINEQGGINGRKINLISSTMPTARRRPSSRPESWSSRKRSPRSSIRWARRRASRSENISTTRRCRSSSSAPAPRCGATTSTSPSSIGFQPSYQAETAVYAKYVLKNKPDAKIALFYQNDDAGKDYGNGFKKGLGPDNVKKMVVARSDL